MVLFSSTTEIAEVSLERQWRNIRNESVMPFSHCMFQCDVFSAFRRLLILMKILTFSKGVLFKRGKLNTTKNRGLFHVYCVVIKGNDSEGVNIPSKRIMRVSDQTQT